MEIGAKLPSEAELGEQYGISRIVAREVLAALVRSGSIYKIKGRGALVNQPASATRIRVDRSRFLRRDVERKGRSVRTQVLGQELRLPHEDEARH
ncbi:MULTISPECIES: GntR family transcriptional regulator [unclassified Variovorax]|uniref:GntR family transcriptional regulator n=1 Tax=unclassified Variovorax TaxID=663243 RepID=UPI003ECD395C